MTESNYYTVGGTIQPGNNFYVVREADEQLFKHCLAGDFCYVLTARQMGKSSLMVHTVEHLSQQNIKTVQIDLTTIGTDLSLDQWYLGMFDQISWSLNLDVDYAAWWDQNNRLGETHRFSQFWRDVVLTHVQEQIVIFVDEIDTTLSLDFDTDDFFAAIRAMYNARATDPAYQRLNFVLLGVARPTDLIKDNLRTPFNIGVQINLTDFTPVEARPLVDGLGFDLTPDEKERILNWIIDWTQGHPYLTQCLCQYLASQPTAPQKEMDIINILDHLFFNPNKPDNNLRFVRDMLTREPHTETLLKLYAEIWAGQSIPDDERVFAKQYLKQLAGVVRVKDGLLMVRNKIYFYAFDVDWIKEILGYTPSVLENVPSQFEAGVLSESVYQPEVTLPESEAAEQDTIIHVKHAFSFSNIWSQVKAWLMNLGRRKKEGKDTHHIQIRLVQADLPLTMPEFVTIQIGMLVGGGIIGWSLSGSLILTVGLAILFYFFPDIYVERRARQRLQAVEEQLGDSISLMANGLRAGYSLLQAIEAVAFEMPLPITEEFGRMAIDIRLGIRTKPVFENLLKRVPSSHLSLLITAIAIQEEVGGNIAEILEIIGYVIRERIRSANEILRLAKPNLHQVILVVMVTLWLFQKTLLAGYFSAALLSTLGQLVLNGVYLILTVGIVLSLNTGRKFNALTRGVSGGGKGQNLLSSIPLEGIAVLVVLLLTGDVIFSTWLFLVLLLRLAGKSWLILSVGAVLLLLVFLPPEVVIKLPNQSVFHSGPPLVYLIIGSITLLILGVIGFYRLHQLPPLPQNRLSRLGRAEQIPTTDSMVATSSSIEKLELVRPFNQRVIRPILSFISKSFTALSPRKIRQVVGFQLELAGKPYNWTSNIFLNLSIFLGLIFGILIFLLTVNWLGFIIGFIMAIPAMMAGFLIPQVWLYSKIRERQAEILDNLPDVLDLLTTSVEAGVVFDGAMQRVAETWDNEVGKAFARVVTAMRLGVPRRKVLKNMAVTANVPELTTFVAAVIQAEQLGVNLAKILRVQSEQMRAKRQQRLEAEINQLNVFQNVYLIIVLNLAIPLWLIAPLLTRLFD